MATVQPTWVAVNYSFCADDGAIGAATWLEAENTAIRIVNGSVFRLRVRVAETANATTNNTGTWTLQFSVNGGTFATVGASTAVQYYDSTNLTNGATGFTGVLSDIAAALDYQSTWNEVVEDGVSASRTWTDDECELEFCCKLNSTAQNDTITFRMLSPQATAITFSNVPTLRITRVASPSAGTVRTVGDQPTLTINKSTSPTVGTLRTVGQQPTVTRHWYRSPGAGTLRIVGQTPTIFKLNSGIYKLPQGFNAWTRRYDSGATAISPTVGAVVVTGQQPTLTVSSGADVSVSPSTGTFRVAGQQPTVAQTWSAAPSVGTVRTVGQQPTVQQTWSASPTVGVVRTVGQQPTVAQTWSAAPTVGTVRVVGQQPTLSQTFSASPSVGTVRTVGQQPTVAQTWSASPEAGEVRLAGQQPLVQSGAGQSVLPTTGTLTFIGQQPTVTVEGGATVSPIAGAVRLTGQAPVLAVTEGWYASPITGVLRFAGQTPTVEGGEAIATQDAPSGGWASYFRYEQERERRRLERELAEEREREELAERLERQLVAEGLIAREQAELARLERMAAQYDMGDLPNRVQRALRYAERAQTELAIQLALREMQRMADEEELAVLMALALD